MNTLSTLARVFHALSDGSRLRVLAALVAAGEAAVNEIVALTGLSQPNASTHLGVLRGAGLVDFRKDGRHHHYRATVPPSLREYIDEVLRS